MGRYHPNVATGLNNLAGLLRVTNRRADAEPLYRWALAIDEKSFGPDHPNVARDLNNLALLLTETDRHAEAEPLYRRALAINEKSFGPDHPDVATVRNNLTLLMSNTKRNPKSEQYDLQTQASQSRVRDSKNLGPRSGPAADDRSPRSSPSYEVVKSVARSGDRFTPAFRGGDDWRMLPI